MDYIENDLAEYLNIPVSVIQEKALTANKRLAQEWVERKDGIYHDNEIYLFDLLALNASSSWLPKVFPVLRTQSTNHLDIGCGIGTLCLLKTLQGHKSTGYDLNNACLDFARYRASKYALQTVFTSAPVDYSEYDLITATDVLEHIEHLDLFIREIGSQAKPGTYLYHYDCFGFQDSNPMHFDHSSHIRNWLEDAGFEVITRQWAIKK